ncbi:hypothetical protein N9452_06240 [Alphaproteobacteria bacterium]|nr:hypothetical protein [Alphaproteobacteria bacterium]
MHGEKVEFIRLMDFGLTGILSEFDRRTKAGRAVRHKNPVKQ